MGIVARGLSPKEIHQAEVFFKLGLCQGGVIRRVMGGHGKGGSEGG